MLTETQSLSAAVLTRPLSFASFCTFLWQAAESSPFLRLETIGASAAGRSLYAASLGGEGDLPAVVFAGTDRLSAAVLLRFLAEYSSLLAEGERLYRIHLPSLFAGRRICVCPMVNPDAMDPAAGTGNALQNSLGADLAAYFPATPQEIPERCPEAAALRQYLLFTEPALFCTFRTGGAAGLMLPPQKASRAGTVGRLLARMLPDTDHPLPAEDPLLPIPAWYAAETGHLSYDISLPAPEEEEDGFYRAYAAVRELLYSAALLI